jgi:hypothetical protein
MAQKTDLLYCGVCGRSTLDDVEIRLFRTAPDGEKLYICKDRDGCRRAVLERRKEGMARITLTT